MIKNTSMVRMLARKPIAMAVTIVLSNSPVLIDTAAADEKAIDLEAQSIVVTGNPLGADSDDLVVPVAVLNGRDLSLRRESTLGETLNSIPGVSSSYFGPNASRPVIRGMDGDRVRIMQNGVGILDASALSPDHAVSVDPLIAEQIDVIRGPATVLYGSGAVGGVVNVVDHRIPKEKLVGIIGRGEARFGGADDERSAAAVIDAGNGTLAIHADAYKRETDGLGIPGFAVSKRKSEDDGTPRISRGRLVNSASEGDGGALGASLTFDSGYVGLSYSAFNSEYGTVAEPSVSIVMDSDRWDFSSEARDLGTFINRVKFRMAHTDYKHQEIEDGEIGTTFLNRGLEGTLEATHGKIGNMSGVLGLQLQNARFLALGDEAFVPSTQTVSQGIYLYEELPMGQFKLSMGGRIDKARVDSAGGGKFGAAQSKDFIPRNLSAGALYSFNENWSLGTNLTHTERAPTQNELFANGPHLATGQFEIGDSSLSPERSNGLDAQLRWKSGKHSFSVGGFYTRFNNFITTFNTGNTVDIDGNPDPNGELAEAVIKAVPAIFKGLESEAKFRIYESLGSLDLNLRGDYVRATNRDTGEPLPRISPMRLGFGLDYKLDQFGSRLDVLRGFKQNRTADNELATDGYTLVNATFTYKFKTAFDLKGVGLEAFAKARNLLDEEIREHGSYLKDIAPLGGRSLLFGLRGEF